MRKMSSKELHIICPRSHWEGMKGHPEEEQNSEMVLSQGSVWEPDWGVFTFLGATVWMASLA